MSHLFLYLLVLQPLDGLLGAQTPTPTGTAAPLPQVVTGPTPHPHVPNASAKPGVACVFFQKGHCLKGDWCPFLHAPNSANTKPISLPVTVEPANTNKPSVGVERPLQQRMAPINAAKPLNNTAREKPLAAVQYAPSRNEFTVSRRAPETSNNNVFSGYRAAAPVSNGNPVSWSGRAQQSHLLDEPESMNSKEAEEVSREPSPGFDVLVDDEGRDSEFYTGEDRYGMSREHETGAEYEIGRSSDYNSIAAIDDERYQGPHGYDSREHRKGQYGWEQRKASSERMPYNERRPYGMPESRGQVDEQDLRHRLAKHKKPNGLRSVISHEHVRDRNVRDRSYEGSYRDERRNSSRENSLGSRLRGRIRLPERSSSPNNRDLIRSNSRIPSQPVSIRDRISGRVEDVVNYRAPDSRRDFVGMNNADFAPPKRLSELKQKNGDSSRQDVIDQQSLGKRKSLTDWHQQSETDLSFEGPKPLEEILKRKKRETSGNNSSRAEGVVEEKNQKEREDKTHEPTTHNEDLKEVDKSTSVQTMEAGEYNPEAEDGGIVGEDGVNPETEPYEQRDGESDYEQLGAEDYTMYDGENGDDVVAEDYVDEEEDDDDDFAKKMGVVYS